MTRRAGKPDRETYVAVGDSLDQPRILCKGCGHSEVIRCPLPVTQLCDILDGFRKRHVECRRQEGKPATGIGR